MKRVVALLLVLGLVLSTVLVGVYYLVQQSSDSGSDRPARSAQESSPDATEPPAPGLERFYSQQLEWQDCARFECARLEVPVDYAEPDGETIEIAVLRVPALDGRRRIGSLVVNPGGPGAPGTSYASQAAFAFREPILRHFDVVGFDPRGTGSSSPVDCLTDEELDEYLAGDPDPDTPAEEQEFLGWVERFGEGCVERTGELIGHVTTIEAARDMDVLRAALGEGSLDYFGASYGTKLGATYAELFPDRVGHFVLDGAVDVSATSREMSLGQAGGFELALRSYVQDCVDGGGCFLGDSVDEGLATIKGLVTDIESDPLPTSSGRELRVGNAFYGIVLPLYNEDYWFLLTGALKEALAGKGDGLMENSDIYSSRGAEGYTDNSAEAIYAINCLDDPWAIEADEVDAEVAEFEEVSPTFGRIFAWGLTGCGGLQVESSEEPLEIDGEGAAPILVTGTTRDPATPYEWAQALSSQLDSGVLISRDGDGHTAYNAGNQCVDEAIEEYLVNGVVPADDLSC